MKTQCHHFFHRTCIAEWFVKSKLQGRQRLIDSRGYSAPGVLLRDHEKRAFGIVYCPICRQEITREHLQIMWPQVERTFQQHGANADQFDE